MSRGNVLEIGIDMYSLPCVKQTASGKLLDSTGSSVQCSVMTWGMGWESGVGGKSKREGMYVYIWLIHFVAQQKNNIVK